jgi:hypothetical protein
MNLSPSSQHRLIWIVKLLLALTAVASAYVLWQWYQDGGGFEAIYVVIGIVVAGLMAALKWLYGQQLSPSPPISPPTMDNQLPALGRQIQQAYGLEDLRWLALGLGVPYENLAGATLEAKIISLLEICRKNGRLPELLAQLREARPHVQWAQGAAAGGVHGRTRANLLNHIRTNWIDGFLKQSLHSEVINLTMNYRPDAVNQLPWQMVLQQSNRPDQPVPPGTSQLDTFTKSGRSLLILGNPGSGKTITMLQLADMLLAAAEKDSNEPIPIVINLSSWVGTKGKLSEWLVEEIFAQYGLKRDLTRAWIAGNQFVYLLDGLDEVAEAVRNDCITAVNDFKANHSAEMVICSRTEDYEKLQNRLLMGAAVQIQPLTDEQVDAYLAGGESELEAVRTTLKTDSDLRELAKEPLMLSMMVLAYQGAERIDLRPRAGKMERRRHIFDNYIRRMFVHRPLPKDNPYTEQQALEWLKNLAAGMVQHGQSIFYIERLQPTWLPDEQWRGRYRLSVGLIFGLLFWLSAGLILGPTFEPTFGPIFGLIFALIFGLNVGHQYYFSPPEIDSFAEELIWKLPSFRILWGEIRFWLIFGLIAGLTAWLSGRMSGELSGELSNGLIFALIFALIFVLKKTVKSKELSQRLQPNQGIHYTAKNALKMMLIAGLLFGLLFWLSLGLLFGLVGLILYGGNTVIKHYILRYLLSQAGILPYPFRDGRLVAYLDAMKDRILLRRVGGGWTFIHRSVMEHFLGDSHFLK